MLDFLFAPIRSYEFTSPVFDYLKNRLLSVKPISTFIYANPKLRERFTRREINERIVETPFILGNLPPPPAKILDVGACESPVALMLASLGYQLTALDLRLYPFPHPNLTAHQGSILNFHSSQKFDIVICLSTLEHIGLEIYGGQPILHADAAAIKKMHQVIRPGGRLLLTTPLAQTAHTYAIWREYTVASLKSLLADFSQLDIQIGYKNRNQQWQVAKSWPKGFTKFGKTPSAVALVIATK